ncbi:glyoxylase-like metal-dependent hydrolase (beta-lactamase superfamily II) [Asanoa ferruginea]|uniref:Glyoxylase-like metal-dependent hydrolase (Beta-lactamase superfamily II) n=1 Tax=Asanoa ferruginea TaxID=53367 RepID=A0A3D9ZH18_9ACTN|nr:MBL fold metallo-hydrolase [Asanoa ferruginea]REF96561.1 glyoxylase-like metal-dependent hydrolase (beta-lactamase superfamily II) [Asanoa ferruginea]GIF52895.1 MBL fold metallo-hydrolase [Asanoa ferruginea]
MTAHVTTPAAALAERLPEWATLVRAPNPGPMTLDGTNTWVLRATAGAPAVVIDPGPLDEGHLRAIAAHGPIGTVLATHGHPDHVEGLDRFAELTGATVLRDLGAHDLAGVQITAVATPGHTADSVCFVAEGAVFTGDTILGRGTTVVAHPDGDLGDYLASLELLTAYSGFLALPGHGPALADCAVAARFYLAHRQARLEQVRSAVANGAKTADEVVATVYADVDRSLWPAAEWSVRAQLAYLGVPSRESRRGSQGLDGP